MLKPFRGTTEDPLPFFSFSYFYGSYIIFVVIRF